MISFENTEIAFAGKSDKDLAWSHRLFKLMGKPWLVSLGKGLTNFALAIRLPIRGIIKKTIFRQFCGGENIQECRTKIQELANYKVGTILDYSVEGKTTEEDLDKTRDEIIATITEAKKNDSIPFSVFKVTGIAQTDVLRKANKSIENLSESESANFAIAKKRVEAICQAAFDANVPVFIDAEDSWFQDIIDALATEMMERYNSEKAIVFNTIQMYRHDRLAFLQKSMEEALSKGYHLGIKLVRGAYMEKEREVAQEEGYPSPIQPDKATTDRDYDLALEYLVKNIDKAAICAGTHNENSSLYLVELMEEHGISKDDKRVYFAQLLGMSDHISFNLTHAGYNVAKYVPYGPVKEVIPYLMRRAQENTSVAGQTGRELKLILEEKQRRKLN
ncbi:MAG: proline dehydrogenase family protein [Crocinitomicaceae bacterium]|nr:proline dehydrogenase family protein [Crocinitomicaceae bacterium]